MPFPTTYTHLCSLWWYWHCTGCSDLKTCPAGSPGTFHAHWELVCMRRTSWGRREGTYQCSYVTEQDSLGCQACPEGSVLNSASPGSLCGGWSWLCPEADSLRHHCWPGMKCPAVWCTHTIIAVLAGHCGCPGLLIINPNLDHTFTSLSHKINYEYNFEHA